MATWSQSASQDMAELAKWEDSKTIADLRDSISQLADRCPIGVSNTIMFDAGQAQARKLKLPVDVRIDVKNENSRVITSVKHHQ